MKLIDSVHTNLLAKAMDVYTLRNRITASNISNIETPGYKKAKVEFEEELSRRLDSGLTSKKQVDQLSPVIKEVNGKPVIEDELMELADTQIRVQMVTRALRHNFEQLRMGIIGRAG
ncbi:MAG: flagellar basal body rod protein FlgB [Balneolaceae bacterium]